MSVPPGTRQDGGGSAPIFIVGCQRSGTTLLRLILDSHPDISCGPETRFLADLAQITGSGWPRFSLYGFPKEYWHDKVARFFESFQQEYAASRGKTRWADKTPLYALSLDYINELFPECQIVHIIRDGRDVVASHRDRWGYWSAVKATVKWARYVETAQAVGRTLPEKRYREIRYELLVTEPERTMRSLLEFLDAPWDDAVLDYQRHQHDVLPAYQEFSSRRRASSQNVSAVYRTRVGSHRKEMDPILRALFLACSARMLRRLGYE